MLHHEKLCAMWRFVVGPRLGAQAAGTTALVQSKADREFQRSYGDLTAVAGALGSTECQALGN